MTIWTRLFGQAAASAPSDARLRIPRLGDAVWWAPKQLGCMVTAVEPDGSIVFQGGEIVRNTNGRQVPRWTVQAGRSTYLWYGDANAWVIGQGPYPRRIPGERGRHIVPQPVSLSGYAHGSFAAKGRL